MAFRYAPFALQRCSVTAQWRWRDANIHVANRSAEGYVALREGRDATLPVPALLLPAVQFNVRGKLGAPRDAAGRPFLRLPLDAI